MAHSLKKLIEMQKCPRAFAAKRLLRLPDPKSPHLQEGIDFHELCESWLQGRGLCFKDGRACDPESYLGRLARAALAYAPPGALPEMNQAFDLFGRTVECHIDSLRPDWASFDDWKSSSGYNELTNESLKNDLQAHWQAYGIMKGSGQSFIHGRWIYADKPSARAGKNVKVRIAEGDFNLQESEAWLFKTAYPLLRLVELFEALPAAPALESVPHDPLSCGGTGRFCAFLGRCKMLPTTGPTLAQLRNAS